MVQIKIPFLGDSINDVRIVKLLKNEGENVVLEEEIVEIETDKVNHVLYASQSGVLHWNVKMGDSLKVGSVIATIEIDESISDNSGSISENEQSVAGAFSKTKNQEQVDAIKEHQLASLQYVQQIQNSFAGIKQPSSQALANSTLQKAQRLTQLEDKERSKKMADFNNKTINNSSSASPYMPPHDSLKKAILDKTKEKREVRKAASSLRMTVANRLLQAQKNMALLTTFNEVDMTELQRLRATYQESFLKKYQTKLGITSFFIKAVVAALKEFPVLNSSLEKDEIVTRNYYDVGFALALEKGLVVPILRDCDQMNIAQIELQIDSLTRKAREGHLSLEEMQGGSFTVSNGGIYGSLLSMPIINPPHSGILGINNIVERPIAFKGNVVIRPMMYIALTYDHCLVDGKDAVSFLTYIKNIIEDPSRLLLDI